jgi:hypothetical protein
MKKLIAAIKELVIKIGLLIEESMTPRRPVPVRVRAQDTRKKNS